MQFIFLSYLCAIRAVSRISQLDMSDSQDCTQWRQLGSTLKLHQNYNQGEHQSLNKTMGKVGKERPSLALSLVHCGSFKPVSL